MISNRISLTCACLGPLLGLVDLVVGGRDTNIISHTTLDSRAAKHEEGGYEGVIEVVDN